MAPVRIVIVGGGLSGIAQSVRLQEALGEDLQLIVYERSHDVGGVWRDSTWPGTAVDVPIHLYCLYSHLNPNFSSKWAGRDEVLAYWKRIVARHHLEKHFVFHTEFVSSRWDSAAQQHTVTFRNTQTGAEFEVVADILISATGALNKPIVPKLPGRESFKGLQFHSSSWRGDVDLAGKRVGVIGNGSTAIQFIPNVINTPGIEIVQFIRSPGYFRPKINFAYSAFQRFVFRWVPFALRFYRWKIFIEYDRNILSRGTGSWTTALREKMTTNIVAYMKSQLPEKYWSALIPDYPMHCKRVAYDAGWLASLRRPNMDLTASPIVEVTPTGLVTKDGKSYEFDILIWATGFEVSETGVGLNHGVYGEDGRELRETWKEAKGAYGYLGVMPPKVPNYFTVLGPNAISQSWGNTINANTHFIARIVRGMHDRSLSSIVVKDQVMQEYNRYVNERLQQTSLASPQCGTSWYKDPETDKIVAPAPWGATELWTRNRKIRWEDFECRRLIHPVSAGGTRLITVDVRSPTTWTPWGFLMDFVAVRIQKKLVRLMTEVKPKELSKVREERRERKEVEGVVTKVELRETRDLGKDKEEAQVQI
ncbi:hypothetical protein JCM8547_000611 [Rhodosporidiobolus lusitaniae]